MAAACLNAGKYVYCESRSASPEQVALVLQAARRAKVFLVIDNGIFRARR
jgi:hypothetical protein